MSYTTDIKEEISKNIGSKSEMIAELSGYIRNNGHNTLNGFQLTTENPLICERIIRSKNKKRSKRQFEL